MAPSRRKGAKKSSAAAASCRQWKVGDLVLAKVKGFPAWPAVVSEPGEWGYSSDQKKVLVHFFGTQQIAFCSPSDVEAFTEEKKQSLAKRQGRGADFVRAVKEIIECYEKLERDTQVDETISGGEVANANVSNSIARPTTSGLEFQVGVPWTMNSQMKSSDSVTDRPALFGAAEDESVVALRDGSFNKEATSDAVVTATVKSPVPVTRGNRLVHRSRRSSQVQNFSVSCSDGGNNDGNISAEEILRTSKRRIKRIRKSPNVFGGDDTDSSAFASNVSLEENGSEIITNYSDACSLNEGSTMDSDLKLEQSETIEYPESEVGLNKSPDHEIKAVIDKKRKSNRLVETNDGSAQNGSRSLQNMCENPKERFSDLVGDEHLPLLKRARVRMCKSPSLEAEHISNAQAQEKSCKENIIDSPQQIITSFNCENGSLADGDSRALNGALVNVSPKLLAPCSENGSQVKNDQIFGCFMDAEMILPPSKRLHRALEAMSANAAEEGACIESSSSIMTSSGRCCISAVKRCPSMTIDNQGEDKSSREVDKQSMTRFQQHESDKGVIPGARNQVGEDLSDSLFCQPAKTDSQVLILGNLPPNLDVQCCQVNSNEDSPGPSLPQNEDDNIRPVNHSNASDTLDLDHGGISLDVVAGTNGSGKLFPQSSINMPQHMVVVSEDMKQTNSDSSKVNNMHNKVVKEVTFEVQEEDTNNVSLRNACSEERGTLGILASPSLSDRGVFLPQGSPPNKSVCNVSTSDSSNILQNGSCSPDVPQRNTLSGPTEGWKDGAMANQRSRSVGKSTEAGDAALLYFEAMLGTLTRTKESISRATRIAVDCAKFGIATKVVEILVHNLETESSLRRRVDLIFLVDSIAQSSRSGKDVGGVYPSAMQAVLPRLLSAAAPPGSHAQENRRQCLKVLRLWLRKRILPESIIRHHIRELNSYGSSASAHVFSRRSLRTERALDDPIREMEGMHVDEYGSNSSFRFPEFCMPRMLEDGGSDSDGRNFEAVTPEHETHEVQGTTHAIEKHRRVLEDVDGELEMEDVAPSFDFGLNSICNVDGGNTSLIDKKFPLSFAPPLPQDVQSSSPLPPSYPPSPPPPPPPPPPTFHLMSATSDQYHAAAASKVFTDLQKVNRKTFHSVAQPSAAPRNSLPITDAVQFRVPESRDFQRQIPESPRSFNTYPVQLPENSRSADGHNKGYILRPPRHVPSDQFSFVRREHHVKSQRDVPPPPSYTNRHHFVENTRRENFYNNHGRFKPPPYDYHERWNNLAPYSGVPAPHGRHQRESTRLPGHGWRFRPPSMNYRNSTPYRPPFEHFEDAIPVTNRRPHFWSPR